MVGRAAQSTRSAECFVMNSTDVGRPQRVASGAPVQEHAVVVWLREMGPLVGPEAAPPNLFGAQGPLALGARAFSASQQPEEIAWRRQAGEDARLVNNCEQGQGNKTEQSDPCKCILRPSHFSCPASPVDWPPLVGGHPP